MARRHTTHPKSPAELCIRLEELVLAQSGGDGFEEVFALVLCRLFDEREARGQLRRGRDPAAARHAVSQLLARIEAELAGTVDAEPILAMDSGLLAECIQTALRYELSATPLEELDHAFEHLTSRGWKGEKGQYFTPRSVIDLAVKLTRPQPGDVILDPACGSGGFLLGAARAVAAPNAVTLLGVDIDHRAIRVARALLFLGGYTHGNQLERQSALEAEPGPLADLILTNPPFAGELRDRELLDRFELGRGRDRLERDVLFLERCLARLKPGGRLGIVLPIGKLENKRWAWVREWLLARARVQCVVGLDRRTFLPHTHQKTALLLVTNEAPNNAPIRFVISQRSGKDGSGRVVEAHDYAEVLATLQRPGAAATRRPSELDAGFVLAASRYDPRRRVAVGPGQVPLSAVCELRRERLSAKETGPCLMVDTNHAREGVLIGAHDAIDASALKSTKHVARPGDVIISRLRPYLRQVALIDDAAPGGDSEGPLACSSEFYVLRSIDEGAIAFVVPYLLSAPVQAALAAAQEGGHHPRFSRETLLSLPLPRGVLEQRGSLSELAEEAAELFRGAEAQMAAARDQIEGALEWSTTQSQKSDSRREE